MSFVSMKHRDVFAVANPQGDMDANQDGNGLYCKDTRYVTTYKLTIGGKTPIFLHKSEEPWGLVRCMLSNGNVQSADAHYERMDMEIYRSQLVYGQTFHDRIEIRNGSRKTIRCDAELRWEARFDDLFEVRGAQRPARGEMMPGKLGAHAADIRYKGLDGIERMLLLTCSEGGSAEADGFRFALELEPGERRTLEIAARPSWGEASDAPLPAFAEAAASAEREWRAWRAEQAVVRTDNEDINRTLERSLADLYMLATDIGYGSFPAAGVPWFCVPFGRDSMLCAIQTLIVSPQLARSTLRTLAALQGQSVSEASDEAPGKILHEMRDGEMANLGEVPFKRYYGSIDSTPLFLVLLSESFRWDGDAEFLREMLPYAERALAFLDEYADLDGDGWIEFHKQSADGLDIQSWKDSKPSMVHRDGTASQSPMAVVEVQGYLYDAKLRMAEIYRVLGDGGRAGRLEAEAGGLKAKFHADFWMADRNYYALALDRDKRQVATMTSDPGHALWSGIVEPAHAGAVADALLSDGLFSGWGIRTMSKDELVYGPLSYHNGSVWPHDNSIIALGLARYGCKAHVRRLVQALFESAQHFPDHRLPELFCGFDRSGSPLIPYPVACSPQAWAAGTAFACSQALLGLQVNGAEKSIALDPVLPDNIGMLEARGIRIGGGRLDVRVRRVEDGGLRVSLDNSTGYDAIVPEGMRE